VIGDGDDRRSGLADKKVDVAQHRDAALMGVLQQRQMEVYAG